jgi:hypothetical protein
MKSILSTLVLIVGLASVAATCNKQPVTPVNPVDAGPSPVNPDASPSPVSPIDGGDSYNQACSNMQVQGCSEGFNQNCAVAMRGAESNKIEFYDSNCLKAATSKILVRACGNKKVVCP